MSGEIDIVVPIFNEAGSLDELYLRVERLGLAGSLLFIDNASSDGGPERIAARGSRLVRHDRNLGYGRSIKDGLAASRAPRVVILDADLEYPPEAIPALVAALDRHPVVYGSRFLGPGAPAMPWARRLGNRVVSGVFNLLFGQRTTDFYTGMKALKREAIDALDLRRDGFEHVVELGAQVSRLGHAIAEVPVMYAPRARGVSKMRHLPETLKYVSWVARYWWRYVARGTPVRPGPRV